MNSTQAERQVESGATLVAGVLHINVPSSFPGQASLRCPTCAKTTRFAVRWYGWYDPMCTCCECGDAWSGNERHQRPFRRGWRKDAIAAAERTWAEAERYTEDDRKAWLDGQLRRWTWLTQ